MIPEDVKKLIEAEANSHCRLEANCSYRDDCSYCKHDYTQGATFGYNLASEEVKALKEEVERLKVLIDKAYAIGWNVSTDKEDFEIKLHSFKKQNNL